ncbi:sulfatase-like hydrolase/transferase [Agaribacter marinus]|uniref:Arylsulfatase n=1 Tax=Agaribacter marinus TaxID=1431249 RepID=A0AA37T2C7_9ALTE|nr:sulfatase-like hydrolase/transferase [Agaribacter marinus]GLR70360.1 arylsulfatase [Agaribacter marinus]
MTIITKRLLQAYFLAILLTVFGKVAGAKVITPDAMMMGGADHSDKPNIILILADDAGYHDFGFHGSRTMLTPNLDRLAEHGILFEQAYVTAAVCGPSRAGILTGRYQQKFGYEENNVPGYMSASGLTGDDMGLPLEETILPQYMKSLGYSTALVGKWHQGHADRFHPTKRGFDYFYGFRGGARSYYAFGENNQNHRQEDYIEEGFRVFNEPSKYLTSAFVDKAINFIDSSDASPFFLFLSLTAVHSPMEAEKSDLAKFPQLVGKRKTLAAMTFSMDKAIGRLLKHLDSRGIRENTLIVFTNDNGGPSDQNASNNAPLSGTKANHLEGGIRVPFIVSWPSVLSKNTKYRYPISTLDLLPTFIAAGHGEPDKLITLDGINLLPILHSNQEPAIRTFFWKKENRAAIRDGDWKLLRYPDRPAELYNLKHDLSETQNVARKKTLLVESLYKKLFTWELGLQRPKWQLKREYEGKAMERMDNFRYHTLD